MEAISTFPSNPGILLNFRIPANLKTDFQEVCRRQHVTMTARLNFMIQEFLKEHKAQSSNPECIIGSQPDGLTDDTWRNCLYG